MGDGRVTVTLKMSHTVSRNLPTLALGGRTTRPAGTERLTGHRGASVSEWQSKEFSLLEFTICIVTLNLQKRKMPKTERFAAHECCVKLFQVPTANGSPKTAGIPDTPASQAAVRRPQFAGSGCTP